MSQSENHSSVLDVGAEQLGNTYARALLGATASQGCTDEVIGQLNQLVDDVLASQPTLAAAFGSPRISVEEKHRVLDRLLGEQIHPTLLKFLKVMAVRERLGHVAAVRDAAVSLHDQACNRVLAEVKTAVPMDEELRSQVSEQLSQKLGKTVRLKEVVDEAVIGGVVVRIGDTVYDSSVASRLQKLSRKTSAGFASRLVQQSDQFFGSQ